jgi:hypothetical protein
LQGPASTGAPSGKTTTCRPDPPGNPTHHHALLSQVQIVGDPHERDRNRFPRSTSCATPDAGEATTLTDLIISAGKTFGVIIETTRLRIRPLAISCRFGQADRQPGGRSLALICAASVHRSAGSSLSSSCCRQGPRRQSGGRSPSARTGECRSRACSKITQPAVRGALPWRQRVWT